MDIKRLVSILVGVMVLMLIINFFLTRILFKETTTVYYPAPAQELDATAEEPSLNYAIPDSAVPSVQDIEKSIQNAEEKKIRQEEIRAEIEFEKKVKDVKKSSPQPGVAMEKTGILPEKKQGLFPTSEEQRRMESSDIMTR